MVSLMNPISEYRDFSRFSYIFSGALTEPAMDEEYLTIPKVENCDGAMISSYMEETNSYQGLTTVGSSVWKDAWKYTNIGDWSYDDVFSWIYDEVQKKGCNPTDFPMYLFQKTTGQALMQMTEDDFVDLLQSVFAKDVAFSFGSMLHDSLRSRIAEMQVYYPINEESIVPESVIEKSNNIESIYTFDENTQNYVNLDVDTKFPLMEYDKVYDAKPWECGSAQVSPCSKTSLESDNEEFLPVTSSKPVKRPPGRPKGSGKKEHHKREKNVSVPEFLRDLLLDPAHCPSIIKWEDYRVGKFRFVQPNQVAKLWGDKKGNGKMSFEKFSRAMRYHYKQCVLMSVPTARLVYQFGPKGPNYQTEDPNFERSYTNGS